MGCANGKSSTNASAPRRTNSSSSTPSSSLNASMQSDVPSLRIGVVGEENTGKTSMIFRFTEGIFVGEGEDGNRSPIRKGSDVQEIRSKEITVDGKKVRITVFDSTGQEKDRTATRPSYARSLQGMLLLYDVTRRETFDAILPWIQEIRNIISSNASKDFCILIVGNKCDCSPDTRQVSPEEGEELAKNPSEYTTYFMETSAKEGTNVEQLFSQFARHALPKLKST
eukprot:TRINITY_DN12183_c0_g1_i1.p1 TRINITY_DN12183_c0_g1~~TRINITY_DN12183_c0_g1_i1.p1  ORF type:complete len:226 (+),score=26.64 TRINITY_DN12183_c0_g1_i1:122-799(+)